jgi:hypothetical protein
MKLTNKYNIPQQILSAIMRDPYSRGEADISATQLIQPPRIVQLKRRHEHEIEEDASDRIWALLGQTCHAILERADQTGAFHEERIWIERRGWKISGQSDVYIDTQFNVEKGIYEKVPPTIRDYKLTKTMTTAFDHPEWAEQTNILAHLWREKGFPVAKLEIVCIYRDWSKVIALRTNDYPPACQTFKQPLWDESKTEDYIDHRVNLHQKAAEIPDEFLPPCTPKEQWRKDPKYAVMHPKKAKAVRVLDTQDAAENYIETVLKGARVHYVEFRPGASTRCEMFCDVKPFCNQYKAEHEFEKKEAA